MPIAVTRMKYSLVASDISVTTGEYDIERELMQRYNGVENVSRWYFDDDEDYPMSCVQIDFSSLEDLNKVLEKGNIVIGGICRRVSIVKEVKCYRCQQTGHKTNQCGRKSLNQQDLMNIFAEQKRRLIQVMNNMEIKLNEVVSHH